MYSPKMKQQVANILFLSVLTLVVTGSQIKILLSAHEGDRVFIPCLNNAAERIAMWKINGNLYPINQLPQELYLQTSPHDGILVRYTTQNISGNFICYTYNENYNLQRISTVNFLVHKRNQTDAGFQEPEELESVLHLVVTPGEIIFIPCISALGTQKVTIWGIDGSLYPSMALPAYHIHQTAGIIVTNITNSIYKCYSVVDSTLQELFTIILHLSEPPGLFRNTFTFNNFLPQYLAVVSNGVELNSNKFYVFQFRLQNVTQNNCSPGNITFTMNVTNGVQSLWRNSTSVYPPSFSPPREYFERDGYAEVYGINSDRQKCVQLYFKIKVDIDDMITPDGCAPENNNVCCVTEGSNGCVQLPENVVGMVVIWPRTPDSELDCVCGVFFGSQDVRFEDCYCLKLNLTIYNVTLVDRHLCWNDLTNTTNNTKVIFAKDAYDSVTNSFQRIFQSEVRFTVEAPDPFPPMFTQERNNTLCINSTNPEWSPVLRTNVTVYDNTGDIIQKVIIPSNDFCLNLNAFPESCAPFTVYATAHTHCSQSDTATFKSKGNSLSCDCLKEKVHFSDLENSSLPLFTSIALTFGVTCFTSTGYDGNITNLYLEAVETSCSETCTVTNTSFTVQCNQNVTFVTIDELKEATNYNLSVVWISPQNSSEKCIILYGNVTTQIADYSVVIASLLSGIVVGVLVGILMYPVCCRRRKTTKELHLYKTYSELDKYTTTIVANDSTSV